MVRIARVDSVTNGRFISSFLHAVSSCPKTHTFAERGTGGFRFIQPTHFPPVSPAKPQVI